MNTYHKKLIEVALPLPEINDASAYDKMPGIGPHPKGIHQWWARLPLPAARAVLFASVVDDPAEHPERWTNENAQNAERERLFDIIREMMSKQLHEHPELYANAREEMLKHCGGKLPSLFDPFAGGGSIPLEANRLGFPAHAADLNPVAVLLNKCNLELAPRLLNRAPVNPHDRERIGGEEGWRGNHGLAADIRYYGRRIRDRARAKIGHLYPTVRTAKETGGVEANVITWLWARTVATHHPPHIGKHVPLISSYWLCTKKGGEAWLTPQVDKSAGTYSFQVRTGKPPSDSSAIGSGTKLGRGAKFACILTGQPLDEDHIKSEGKAGRLGTCLLATIAEGKRGRLYLPATEAQLQVARIESPETDIDQPLADDPRNIWCVGYGLTRFPQLFTPRQLTALVTLSDLIRDIRAEVRADSIGAGNNTEDADAYARALVTFLALALDRCASFNNSLCRWNGNQTVFIFTRQAIPMVWDFSEANIMGEKAVCWHTAIDICADAVETIATTSDAEATARQIDAALGVDGVPNLLVSTDPPYYDNISYAGLSDFFYVWLRRTVGDLYPQLFSTLLVPKIAELTASPERFEGNKQKAKEHFEKGFRSAFTALREKMDPRFPLTVYYAFKQDDEEKGGKQESLDNSEIDLTTGWETLLEALVGSGFQITATWPVRASFKWRTNSLGTNSLASYIILGCRPRSLDAPQTDRRSFVSELKRELPSALRHLQQGNIAPVDFAQAAIGPGIAIFSRYGRILETTGNPMSVRNALSLINQILTEVLSEQEDEFDSDTRWSIAWFEQHGFNDGEYGEAEVLSKAKVTSVKALRDAGLVRSTAGKVRLLRPEELAQHQTPTADKRLTIWEATHQLLRAYYAEKKGDEATADILRQVGSLGETARDLAYRLFSLCEKKKRTQEAQAYNALVLGWPEIARLARQDRAISQQTTLFER